MSSPPSAGPNTGFQSRLNRVAERRAPIEAAKPEVSVLPDWRENVAGKAGMAVAVLIGLIAVILVRIGAYHVVGTAMVSDTPDFTLAIEMVAALMLAILLFRLTPYRGVKYHFANFAGVALMASMMHNAVHSVPGAFSLAFSSEWTAQVLAETEPNSLYLRGEVVPFTRKEEVAEVEEPEQKLPTVRRMN